MIKNFHFQFSLLVNKNVILINLNLLSINFENFTLISCKFFRTLRTEKSRKNEKIENNKDWNGHHKKFINI